MKYHTLLPYSVLLSSCFLMGCGTSTTENEDTETKASTETTITSSALIINEIVASATDGGSDWIELYAREDIDDLSTYSLTDDNEERVAQALPSMSLAQGQFIVIKAIDADDAATTTGHNVTFKLGSDDAVTLFNNGDEVQTLDWEEGDALEGYSFGYIGADSIGGTDDLGVAEMLSPTEGVTNEESSDSNDSSAEETVLPDGIINNDPELRINEIVAKDNAGGYDWIELYVTGANSVYLGDYTVADSNNELIALPEVTLASGEFYRVYATTDIFESSESSESIETVSFNLGNSDQVSLLQGDDLIDQLSWKKGQALIDFSYGRFPDGSDATQMLIPTPVEENSLAYHGPLVINEVVATDVNGGYDWFELYNTSDSDIALSNYQVIDESDDIESASLPDVVLSPNEYIVIYATDEITDEYSVPFKLGKSDELNLLLNDETVDYIDWDESDLPAGFSYGLSYAHSASSSQSETHIETQADSDNESTTASKTWDKDTLTPTKGAENALASAFDVNSVQNLSITITTENWASILANPLDEEYHEASITLNGVTLDSVAIRTKGGSSLNSVANSTSDRYSFKLDINEYVSGQKFFGLKKFTLQNSFNDPSYMREVIAYDLLEEMGVATPKHSYVNVYINDELFGFYLMVEAIDGEFLENNFANANGDLYKPDGTGSDLQWINSSITSYSDINLQTNEDSTDNGAFMNFVEKLDQGSTDVINVDSLLRYMSVSVALSNLDSYFGSLAHNYYLYEQDGQFSLLPWDFNESFGTFNMGCSVDIRELYIDEPSSGSLSERPLLANVFADADNLDVYHDYLWQLIEGPLESSAFEERVNNIADLIREHVANDPSAFYSASQFEQNLTSTVDRFYGLTDFMTYRVSNMVKQLEGDLPSVGTGIGFCGGTTSGGRPQR